MADKEKILDENAPQQTGCLSLCRVRVVLSINKRSESVVSNTTVEDYDNLKMILEHNAEKKDAFLNIVLTHIEEAVDSVVEMIAPVIFEEEPFRSNSSEFEIQYNIYDDDTVDADVLMVQGFTESGVYEDLSESTKIILDFAEDYAERKLVIESCDAMEVLSHICINGTDDLDPEVRALVSLL